MTATDALKEIERLQQEKRNALEKLNKEYDERMNDVRNRYVGNPNFLRDPNYQRESQQVWQEREQAFKQKIKEYDDQIAEIVKELQNDGIFMESAIEQYYPTVLQGVKAENLNNPSYVMGIVSIVGCGALEYAGDKVRNSRAYIMAMEETGLTPKTDKYFPVFVSTLIKPQSRKIQPTALEFASEELRSDYDFCLQVIEINPKAFRAVKKGLDKYDVFLAKVTLNNPQMLYEFTRDERKVAIKVLKDNGLYNDRVNDVYQSILRKEKEASRQGSPFYTESATKPATPPKGPRPDNRLVRDPYGGVHTVDQVRGNRCIPGKDQSHQR